ncbi:acyl-CoA dehydrogenase family protein [Mycobacterium avium]
MKRLVLEPEHEAFRETVRQFIDRELVPHAEQWERDRLAEGLVLGL